MGVMDVVVNFMFFRKELGDRQEFVLDHGISAEGLTFERLRGLNTVIEVENCLVGASRVA